VATADTGTSWRDITPTAQSAGDLAAVYFVDATAGWSVARGTSPSLARTTDAGLSWSAAALPVAPAQAVALAASDSLHLWLLNTLSANSNSSSADLWASVDGGLTWVKGTAPSTGELRFISPLVGFLAYRDTLSVTRDAGRTWQKVSVVVPSPWQSAKPAFDLPMFFDATSGALSVSFTNQDAAGFAVYATRDAGTTWQLVYSVTLSKALAAYVRVPLAVADRSTWIAVAPSATDVASTQDGGASHQTKAPTGLPEGVESLSAAGSAVWALSHWQTCSGPKEQLVCAESWQLSRSTDRGQTWGRLTP